MIETVLIATHPELISAAQELSQQWLVPYGGCRDNNTGIDQSNFQLLLQMTPTEDYQLALTSGAHHKPFVMDFCKGKSHYRIFHGGGKNRAITRAIGLKSNHKPYVIDATAGLGQDGFVLAYLGCQVLMLERSKVVAMLLQDAIRRARQQIGTWVEERLQLVQDDACHFLSQPSPAKPEVIYLDPMYPGTKTGTALVKKEMRLLRQLVGEDKDSDKLLQTALQQATKRVVVKRPKGATPLCNQLPNHTIESKNTRYDVYMIF